MADKKGFELTDGYSRQLQVWQSGEHVEMLISTYGDFPESVGVLLEPEEARRLGQWLLSERANAE